MTELCKSYMVTEDNGNQYAVGLVTETRLDRFDIPWRIIVSCFLESPFTIDDFCTYFGEVIYGHPAYTGGKVLNINEIIDIPNQDVWTSSLWTHEDESAAEALGWGIFWADDIAPEIQRVDEMEVFPGDDEAAEFVWRLADNGHPLCVKAIAAIQACYP